MTLFFYTSFSDLTHILEKIKINKLNYTLLCNLFTIKIQENILSKCISITNNNILYINNIKQFYPISNLSNYIINNFPINLPKLKPINSIISLETQVQSNYLKNEKRSILCLKNINDKINIHSIECMFEIFLSKISLYLISPTLGIFIDSYKYNQLVHYLEIPIQSLLSNLNIILTSVTIFDNFKYIKIYNSLVIGGDVMTTGNFSPDIVTKCYNNMSLELTSMYVSSKNTSIYIYNILLESFIKQYKYQGICLPSFLFEIIVSRMVSYAKIYNIGDTSLVNDDILPITLINLINQSLSLNGMLVALYHPIIIGISKLSIGCSGLLSSISFQHTLKSLSILVVNNQIDWLLDLKSKIILSDILNTGTGWYKHYIM